jgi:hypothetical protein
MRTNSGSDQWPREEVEPACHGAHFREVDMMEGADRIDLEPAPDDFAVFDLWHARDAVALQAAMQR